ncbi:MAG: phosphatase PAP2 family protein [Planctomycetes bacterium]|nr:phosphatase PAP2 family protein [Planctomycetota bacterium]
MIQTRTGRPAALPAAITLAAGLLAAGCTMPSTGTSEIALRTAIKHYAATRSEQAVSAARTASDSEVGRYGLVAANQTDPALPYFTLGMMPEQEAQSPETQPITEQPTAGMGVPEGYWREDVWHQMDHEFRDLCKRELWRGFKTSFWDLENALLLTAAMGASVTIRETGVDGTIRNRTHGHRQLGDGGEVIGILGNPGTHFAGAGILWLTSTLTKDAKQHEVAKALTEALAVTGITTLGLKFTAQTREPDGDPYAWPSGHTSSTVAVAAVLNEYYGPWVGVPCFALAGLVGYERLDSREHDLSDVVFGAMLGYVVGTSIARDEKAQFPELWGMKVVPFADVETGTSGLALMKSW